MNVPSETSVQRINEALAGVNPSAPSTAKFLPLDAVLAEIVGIPASHVVSVTVSKPGNFSVRAMQSERAVAARLIVGVVTDPAALSSTKAAAVAHVEAGLSPVALLLQEDAGGDWQAVWGVAASDVPEEIRQSLTDAFGTTWESVDVTAKDALPWVPTATTPAVVPMHPLILDDRIRRMFRTAVASRVAVMLVGPPGTGKSRMVQELLQDIAQDPTCVGMQSSHEAYVTTPDESWTSRELVGGDTIDDKGRLRFAPGVVLDAITQDRWLILDEANRADMDRIFGGLMTWLSGQDVTVGRISGEPGAGPVDLGWAESPESVVDGLERLRDDEPGGDPVTFLAGTEWRLIGTYNALDAQRVFRFGLALGRRFAHVPVPAPDTAGFRTALASHLHPLDASDRAEVGDQLARIYEAHQSIDSASVGPAAFLSMPSYIAHGIALGGDAAQVLAEAYLTSIGSWLARLEEQDLDRLGALVGVSDLLDHQWHWVRGQLSALR